MGAYWTPPVRAPAPAQPEDDTPWAWLHDGYPDLRLELFMPPATHLDVEIESGAAARRVTAALGMRFITMRGAEETTPERVPYCPIVFPPDGVWARPVHPCGFEFWRGAHERLGTLYGARQTMRDFFERLGVAFPVVSH
jgi:hypothetical protein